MPDSVTPSTPLDLPAPLTDEECAEFSASLQGQRIADTISFFGLDIDASNYALMKHLMANGMTDTQINECARWSVHMNDANIALHNLMLLTNEPLNGTKTDLEAVAINLGSIQIAGNGKKLSNYKLRTVCELQGVAATIWFIEQSERHFDDDAIIHFTDEGATVVITDDNLRRLVHSRPKDTDKIIAYLQERGYTADTPDHLNDHLDSGLENALNGGWL